MDPIDKLLGEMLGMSDQFIRIELPHLLELLGPRLYDSPVTIDRINITARGVFMEHFLKHPDQFARAAGNMDAITRAMVIAADENGSEELAELILRYVHSSGLDRYSVYMDNPGLWYNAAAKTGRREMLRMLLPREKAIFDAIDAGEAADSVGDDGLLTILEDLAK